MQAVPAAIGRPLDRAEDHRDVSVACGRAHLVEVAGLRLHGLLGVQRVQLFLVVGVEPRPVGPGDPHGVSGHKRFAETHHRAALLGGGPIPFGGDAGIGRDAVAGLIGQAERELRLGHAQIGRLAVPGECLFPVGVDQDTIVEDAAETELRGGEARLRRAQVPFDGADGIVGFAETILELIDDPGRARDIGRRGYARVRRHFLWEHSEPVYLETMRKALNFRARE